MILKYRYATKGNPSIFNTSQPKIINVIIILWIFFYQSSITPIDLTSHVLFECVTNISTFILYLRQLFFSKRDAEYKIEMIHTDRCILESQKKICLYLNCASPKYPNSKYRIFEIPGI